MHLAEIPQLNSASPEQKLALIDELWASIPPAALPTPSAHLTELDQRLADLRAHPEKALSPEAARARLRTLSGL
jgi:putative addiction module component (TIGR02574 family)